MKKVTNAYDKKDLTTLLRLEMEWVHNTTEHLDKLTDDKLNIYISALKRQVAELETEKFMLYRQPQYDKIFYYCKFSEKAAIAKIIEEQKKLENNHLQNENIVNELSRTNSKKQVVSFVKEYKEIMKYNYFDDLFN